MSLQLGDAVKELLSLGHHSNGSAGTTAVKNTHEGTALAVLLKWAFTLIERDSILGLTAGVFTRWLLTGDETELRTFTVNMLPGTIIHQPCGSQGTCDIFIFDFNGRFVPFECKSSDKGMYPTWNDKVAHLMVLYWFSTNNTSKDKYPGGRSTIFLGKDVITLNELNLWILFKAEIQAVIDKYIPLFSSIDAFNRGWYFFWRPKNSQKGGKFKTSYFDHPASVQCVKNALDFAYL